VILTEFETKMEGAFKFFEYLKVGAKTVYCFCDKKREKGIIWFTQNRKTIV
jgi:hypothetical protein